MQEKEIVVSSSAFVVLDEKKNKNKRSNSRKKCRSNKRFLIPTHTNLFPVLIIITIIANYIFVVFNILVEVTKPTTTTTTALALHVPPRKFHAPSHPLLKSISLSLSSSPLKAAAAAPVPSAVTPKNSTEAAVAAVAAVATATTDTNKKVVLTMRVQISEHAWRKAADLHMSKILELIRPGLLAPSSLSTSTKGNHNDGRNQGQQQKKKKKLKNDKSTFTVAKSNDGTSTPLPRSSRSLDPRHPVYNFLVEYYGLKGSKGVRRLTRWSPPIQLLLLQQQQHNWSSWPSSLRSESSKTANESDDHTMTWTIESYEELVEASSRKPSIKQPPSPQVDDRRRNRQEEVPRRPPILRHEIVLEGACEDDFGEGRLHLRGATRIDAGGVLYCPTDFFVPSSLFLDRNDEKEDDGGNDDTTDTAILLQKARRRVSPFLWYQSILQQTASKDPILHCYNLHEWAMQYRPEGAPVPPSSKYQKHLPLRVSQQVINETIERKGVSCTHVDALRFFAEDAVGLNKYGEAGKRLERHEQPEFEQPGCLHAQMDLLKMYLKLQPFVDASLLLDVLEIALESRKLDVAASPYDSSSYGIEAIPIETHEGRSLYRERQTDLYHRSQSIRQDVLHAYNDFLELTTSTLGEDIVHESHRYLPASGKEVATS